MSASVAELRRSLAEAPPEGRAQAHARLGTALLRAGSARDAEGELRRALELDPGCAAAWVNLGGILLARWEFEAAIDANRKASEADPSLALAWFNQAVGHLHLGQPLHVVECLGKVVELEPGNGAAFYHLGIALYALDRALEARLCLAYAAELGYRPVGPSAEALDRAAAADAAGARRISRPDASPSTSAEGERHGTAQGR